MPATLYCHDRLRACDLIRSVALSFSVATSDTDEEWVSKSFSWLSRTFFIASFFVAIVYEPAIYIAVLQYIISLAATDFVLV